MKSTELKDQLDKVSEVVKALEIPYSSIAYELSRAMETMQEEVDRLEEKEEDTIDLARFAYCKSMKKFVEIAETDSKHGYMLYYYKINNLGGMMGYPRENFLFAEDVEKLLKRIDNARFR